MPAVRLPQGQPLAAAPQSRSPGTLIAAGARTSSARSRQPPRRAHAPRRGISLPALAGGGELSCPVRQGFCLFGQSVCRAAERVLEEEAERAEWAGFADFVGAG